MQNRLFCALYNGVPLVRDVSQVTYIYKSVSIKFNLMQMPCDFTGPYSQDFQSGGGGGGMKNWQAKKRKKEKRNLDYMVTGLHAYSFFLYEKAFLILLDYCVFLIYFIESVDPCQLGGPPPARGLLQVRLLFWCLRCSFKFYIIGGNDNPILFCFF